MVHKESLCPSSGEINRLIMKLDFEFLDSSYTIEYSPMEIAYLDHEDFSDSIIKNFYCPVK
jgi:hypothetical protein